MLERLNAWGRKDIKISKSKIKRLLKQNCGYSYKKKVAFNAGKATVEHIELREKWIRLYYSLTHKYDS